MEQDNVDVVRLQFAQEALDIGGNILRISRRRLRTQRDGLKLELCQCLGQVFVCAVAIGTIPEGDPPVIGIQ